MADNAKFVQGHNYRLTGSGISAVATSVTVSDFTDIYGNTLALTDFGTIGYVVFEPGTSKAESASFTGVTNNGDGTYTLTGLTRGLAAKAPYTAGAGFSDTHSGGAVMIITNSAAFYNELTSKDNDETINGIYTFVQSPVIPTGGTGTQAANATDIANAITGASGTATNLVNGTLKLSVAAVSAPAPIAVGQNDPDFVNYFAETGAANAYVLTPSPSIGAYAVGKRYSFKAVNANTTVSTLNINALGAKTIKRADGTTDLVANDILAGQIVAVEYDGVNFIMLSGTGNLPPTASAFKFGGTGTDGALAISSGTTTIDCANAATVTKNYTSISITGTAVLAFINPHANGTTVTLKSQGVITLTSSSTPMINMSAMGASGGTGGAGTSAGAAGSIPNGTFYVSTTVGGGGGIQAAGSGAAGVAPFSTVFNLGKYGGAFLVGAGGGGGGGGGATGAVGGKGGGGLILECAGAFNFTTTSGISVAGQAGTNGAATSGAAGGGGGGFCLIRYATLTANTGTITVSGGIGGTAGAANSSAGSGGASQINNGSIGGGASGAGGIGGAGWSSIAANTDFS